MALLPALIQQMRPAETTELALPLIFARSLGQLCGPLLLKADNLERYASHNRYLVGCLLAFLAAYSVLPGLTSFPEIALLIIFAAHLASNMVFAVGTFGLLHNFHADTVPTATAKVWRWQSCCAAVATLIAALLAAEWGAAQALYTVSFSTLALVMMVLLRYRS